MRTEVEIPKKISDPVNRELIELISSLAKDDNIVEKVEELLNETIEFEGTEVKKIDMIDLSWTNGDNQPHVIAALYRRKTRCKISDKHKILQLLLENENVKKTINNPYGQDGNTVLHWICFSYNTTALNQLIKAGANALVSNSREHTCLQRIVMSNISQKHILNMVKALFSHLNKNEIKQLLQTGQDHSHRPGVPLIEAAKRSYSEVVDFLITNGADPLITRNGNTALHVCCTRLNAPITRKDLTEEDNQKTMEVFFRHLGPSSIINKTNLTGDTVLRITIRQENWNNCRFLLDNGASCSELSEEQMSLLKEHDCFRPEWRPNRHSEFPKEQRWMLRTLVILARARNKENNGSAIVNSKYMRAGLECLPEELLQYLFIYVCCPPFHVANNPTSPMDVVESNTAGNFTLFSPPTTVCDATTTTTTYRADVEPNTARSFTSFRPLTTRWGRTTSRFTDIDESTTERFLR